MTQKTLEEYIDVLKTQIEYNFKTDAEIVPVFLLLNNDFEIFPVQANPDNDSQKAFMAQYILPSLIQKNNVSVVITISEVWMKMFDKDSDYDPSKKVSDYADRIEAVMLNVETLEKTTTFIWEIKRPKDKKPYLEFKNVSDAKYPQIKGQYTNFLHSITSQLN